MFTNDGGGAVVFPLADLTLILLVSPLLTWSFLLLRFLSLSFVPSQSTLRTIGWP